MEKKTKKPKKEKKQVVEIHIYIHQLPIQTYQPIQPPYNPNGTGTTLPYYQIGDFPPYYPGFI
jgi:hypothetical protein